MKENLKWRKEWLFEISYGNCKRCVQVGVELRMCNKTLQCVQLYKDSKQGVGLQMREEEKGHFL